ANSAPIRFHRAAPVPAPLLPLQQFLLFRVFGRLVHAPNPEFAVPVRSRNFSSHPYYSAPEFLRRGSPAPPPISFRLSRMPTQYFSPFVPPPLMNSVCVSHAAKSPTPKRKSLPPLPVAPPFRSALPTIAKSAPQPRETTSHPAAQSQTTNQ